MYLYLQAPRTKIGKDMGFNYLNQSVNYTIFNPMIFGWVKVKRIEGGRFILDESGKKLIYCDKKDFKVYTKYYDKFYYYANVRCFNSENPSAINKIKTIKETRFEVGEINKQINELKLEKLGLISEVKTILDES